jgi:hypothetical protein
MARIPKGIYTPDDSLPEIRQKARSRDTSNSFKTGYASRHALALARRLQQTVLCTTDGRLARWTPPFASDLNGFALSNMGPPLKDQEAFLGKSHLCDVT